MYKIPVYSQCCLVMLQFSSRAQHIRLLAKWEEMRAFSFLQDQASHIPWSCRSCLNKISLASMRVLQGRALQKGPPAVQHVQSVGKSLKWHTAFQRKSELVNTENNNNISTSFTALFACNCINAQPLINNSINTQGKVAECNTYYNLLYGITSTGSYSLSSFHEILPIPLPPEPSSHKALCSQFLTAFRPVRSSATGP